MAADGKIAYAPLPKFRDRLEFLAGYLRRPLLHGELALDMCCSLEQVTREMDPLVESRAYRALSVEELVELGMDPRVLAYVRA